MLKNIKTNLLTIITLFPLLANAGGMSWQIEIHDFQRLSDTEAKALISTLNETKSFDNCSKIDILFDFDLKKIESTSIKNFVSKDSQIESLERLAKVSSHAKPVMVLGSMGSGFKKTGNYTFKSIGLGSLKEYSGRTVIYSFYDPI
ncbi:hypothetical protein A7985_07345 [Pseudoalteromonas luteoviolacea]|uniref:Uncharacterized protein n=1 Tax=Pseudoalteromonas luteoviolacea TaxID=43657 RepID=A0A1C0TWP2_9GAMM|nr:hypothetical protein [Pseudoalteromonas luteoviolacea]OCQ23746.1 hypothetical protein A7985_07345 [Pseudoalteromonas luteoviolacea]